MCYLEAWLSVGPRRTQALSLLYFCGFCGFCGWGDACMYLISPGLTEEGNPLCPSQVPHGTQQLVSAWDTPQVGRSPLPRDIEGGALQSSVQSRVPASFWTHSPC